MVAAGERFDVVCAMEVVEHVTALPAFVRTACQGREARRPVLRRHVQPDACAPSRSPSWGGIRPRLAAEGAPTTGTSSSPRRAARAVEAGGLSVTDTTGVVFNPLTTRWAPARDTAVNYMIAAERPRPDEATPSRLLSFAHETLRGDGSMLEKIPTRWARHWRACGPASRRPPAMRSSRGRARRDPGGVTSRPHRRVGAAGPLHPGRGQALAAACLERDPGRHRRPGAARGGCRQPRRRSRSSMPSPGTSTRRATAWPRVRWRAPDPTARSRRSVEHVPQGRLPAARTRRTATARTATCSRSTR